MSKLLKIILVVLALCLAVSLAVSLAPLKKSEDILKFEEDPNNDPTAGEPQELTFQRDSVTYTYLSNMTFREFIESDYNTDSGDLYIDQTSGLLCYQGAPICDSYGFLYGDNLIIGITETSVNTHVDPETVPTKDTTANMMQFTDSSGKKHYWTYESWMRFSDFLASDKCDSLGFGYDPETLKVRLDGKTIYGGSGEISLGSPCSKFVSYDALLSYFSVDGFIYEYVGGMTWGEFIESDYNVHGFIQNAEGQILDKTGEKCVVEFVGDSGNVQYASMVISNGAEFTASTSYTVNVNGEMYDYDVGMTWDEFYQDHPECLPPTEPPGVGGYGGGMEEPGPS